MAYRSKFTGAEVDSLLEQVQKGEVGGSVTVDSSLSTTSENPVMNKAITEELNKKLEGEVVGATSPTEGTIGGARDSHNIGSIDLFEQIIAQKQNHNLTLEDKEAILSGKVITTSAGNGVVPTISSNSMGENGAVLIFHFNERLYEMFVMWTDTLCYINGVFSFTREAKLYADSELSETSENSVQNKVVTEKLTELSAEKEDKKNKVTSLSDESTDVQYPSAKTVYDLIKRLEERIVEQDQFIEDLQNTKIDRENDDYYPKMAVGLADNLAGVDVVDSEIHFRRTGGGAISDGVARIESIKGNSVVWNQVFKPNINAYGSQFVKTEDDGLTMEVIKEPSEKFLRLCNLYMGIASHKYFIAFDVVSGSYTEGETRMHVFGQVFQPNVPLIISLSEAKNIDATLRVVGCTGMRFRVRTIDLTQMFGPGYEPTTIEEFYSRIPMGVDLNAYNEGEVIHMDVQSIESVGANQWDEEWENGTFASSTGLPVNNANYLRSKNFFPVLPNTAYYGTYKGSSLYIFWYDKDKNYIKNQGMYAGYSYTSPSNAAFAKFYTAGTTYNHDICINISDTSINGKYFPYIKRVEDLAVIRKYFPQGMKSAPTAHDAIRYNKESGKWEKVEAIGIRAYQEGDADNATYLTDGKVTCYPLAEPIVTELDEADQFKDLDYQVWNAGTEKAIAEGKSSPLAADITYGFNAIGKIKELESLVAALRAKVGI